MNEERTSPIVGLLRNLYAIFEATGPDPRRDSPADREIRSFSRPESIRTAFSQARIALESAADHLEALDTLIQGKEYAIAPWTCARGLLEASAIATWLLDTRIGARERVSRSLSLRFATLREQEKMAGSAGEHTITRKIQDRIESVKKIAAELGFRVARNTQGNRIWIAQPKPQFTDLVGRQFGNENIYRILSALAHSDYGLLLEVAFLKDYRGHSNGLLAKRAIPNELQAMQVSISAAVYTRGAWLQTIQFGYDAARVAVVLEKRFNELKLADTNEVRFWRTVVGGGT